MSAPQSSAIQRRIATDLLTYLPAKLLPSITPFITVPVYTHLFSPDEFGRYVLAFGVSELLMAATITGFASGAVRFFVAYKRQGNLSTYFAAMFISFLVMVTAGALVCSGLLLALKPRISPQLYPILWVAIPTFAASSLSELLMNILRAQERRRSYSAFEMLNRGGTVAFSLLLVLVFDVGVAGLLWGQCIMLALTALPLIWLTTRELGGAQIVVSPTHLRQIWGFALPITIGNVAVWALRMSDRYFIESFWNSYEVGLYSVSYNIASRSVFFVVGLFLLVPAPIMMRVWEEEGRQAAEKALRNLSGFFLLIVVPVVVGFAVLANPLVRLLAADEYLAGYRAGWLVALAMLAQGLGELASFGLLLAIRSRVIARNQLIVSGINLVLNLVLIPLWGFMGAALSACLSFSLLVVLQAYASSKYLTWRWPTATTVRVVTASAVMALAAHLVVSGVLRVSNLAPTPSDALAIVSAVAVGGVVYFVVLWLMGEEALKIIPSLFTKAPDESVSQAEPSSV